MFIIGDSMQSSFSLCLSLSQIFLLILFCSRRLFFMQHLKPGFLLADWPRYHTTLEMYLSHPASTVRQAASSVFKYMGKVNNFLSLLACEVYLFFFARLPTMHFFLIIKKLVPFVKPFANIVLFCLYVVAKDSSNPLMAKLVLQGLAAECTVNMELLQSASASETESRRASVIDFVQSMSIDPNGSLELEEAGVGMLGGGL